MKKLLAFVLLAGIGGYFAYRHYFSVEKRSCAKLAALCSDKANDVDKCTDNMKDLRKQLGDEVVRKFDACVAEAKSCVEGAGCMVGAGASGVGDAINQFMKGMGKAINK